MPAMLRRAHAADSSPSSPFDCRERSGAASKALDRGRFDPPSGVPMLAIALVGVGLFPGSTWTILLVAIVLGLGSFVACWLIFPVATLRFVVWLISKLFYRIRVEGYENVPKEGPALLVANHVSWLDGILLLLVNRRIVHVMVYEGNFRNPFMRKRVEQWGAIPVGSGPKLIVRALRTARDYLRKGELVGMFAEGGVTRSGMMQGFRPGMMKVLGGTQAPVIPVYFDGLWGSIFSFERGKLFWKIPRRCPYPIQIRFGEPVHGVEHVQQAWQAVQQLGAVAVEKRIENFEMSLLESAIRACKKSKFRSKVADSAGVDLPGGQLLMRALILRRLLRRHVLQPDEQYVGVLLPPSVGATIVNLALGLDRRTVVNLNYTVSSEIVQECIQQAKIRRILTSRKVVEKLDLKIDTELVYLEDLKGQVELVDKLIAASSSYLVPARLLTAAMGLRKIDVHEVLTIIFTSGSTGIPKGVMLTHGNVRHNVDAVEQVIHIQPRDAILGILPFFHSFGYTVTLWGVLTLNGKGVYHYNPLDARQVGKLCARHQATILLSTPTFLRNYIRRCEPQDFASLDTVVTGAEKMPKEVADAFEAKFDTRPVEGYGTTELSPLVSVNIPASRSSDRQMDRKEGSVGRPVPGVAAKVIDLDDAHDLPTGQPGMLLIKGANVMRGYLDQPEKTAEVIRDGWYVTGDVAIIDEEGFIHITGRESRFSKIGGEMVPHVKVEESLQRALRFDRDDAPAVAVTAVPDLRKGERLVVVHTKLDRSPSDLCADLRQQGLPNLFIPSSDSFFEVPELPVLGTGKLDLRRVKQLAEQQFGPPEPE